MKVKFDEIRLKTSRRIEILDITSEVEEIVEKSEVKNGLCFIFCPHATCFIILEEAESGLIEDIKKKIEEDFLGRKYMHDRIDDNAFSHLASGFYYQGRLIPIRESKLLRGTWQNVLFVEADGPRRERRVIVEIIGE